MAYDPGAIDATLAAAVGDDPQLIAELRVAFGESALRDFAAVEMAMTQRDWESATGRLKSLAASFGATRLMAAADAANRAPVGDDECLKRIRHLMPRL